MDKLERPGPDETQPSASRKSTQPTDAGESRRRWLELTEHEPANPDGWIGLAESARDLQERISSLNHALEVDPGNLRARRGLDSCMRELLRRDPRLEYLGETGGVYRLRTAENFEFTHPKDRALPEPTMSGQNAPRKVYAWLKWAVVGLIPAGLGTLFFGPLATLEAIALLRQPLADGDRRRIRVAAALGTTLWLLALIPLVILLLHLM